MEWLPASVVDAVGERTDVSAVDLIDEQVEDRGWVVVEGCDGEVEISGESAGGAGIDLAKCSAAFERHQAEESSLGQVTQQQILGDVDDRSVAALR